MEMIQAVLCDTVTKFLAVYGRCLPLKASRDSAQVIASDRQWSAFCDGITVLVMWIPSLRTFPPGPQLAAPSEQFVTVSWRSPLGNKEQFRPN